MTSAFRVSTYLSLLALCSIVALLVAYARVPSVDLLFVITGAATTFLFLLALASLVGLRRVWLQHPELRRAILFVTLVTLGVLVAHFYIVNVPSTSDCYAKDKGVYGCVMDESYYVPAAQAMVSGEHCQPYADSCNLEHPPLAKALVAAGIAVFGFNDLGWRFFSIILGTACIPLLFVAVLSVSKNARFASLASLLLAADTMFFVHSSAALIDVQGVFFALVAFVLYLSEGSTLGLDRFLLAGIGIGLAGLSKETALFFLGGLLTYHALFYEGSMRGWAASSLKIVLAAAITFVLGLQLYDSAFTGGSVPTFIQHLQFMLKYGESLGGSGWTDILLKIPITPLQWLVFYSPVSYLVTNVTVSAGEATTTYVGVGYYGVPNMIVVWVVFAWIPLLVLDLRRQGTMRRPAGDLRAGVLALIWFLWGYLPYIALWLLGRVTYPFYMVGMIPALAIGAAFFASREWFPSSLTMVYVAAVLFWFFYYFPEKSFLPIWLRALIGK